jgi:HEAT repeat protein
MNKLVASFVTTRIPSLPALSQRGGDQQLGMRFRSPILVSLIVFVIAAITLSQNQIPATRGGPASLTELLKQHDVELTETGLLNALRSPDAQIRYLAAAKLAAEKTGDAVPAITEALMSEKVPGTRINIAFALAQLGEEKGVQELTSSCGNPDLTDVLRARAITYLLDLQSDSCLREVLEMLKPESDSSSRIQALSLLPRYDHLSKQESQEISSLILKALGDSVPAVRINAGIALGGFGNIDAVPYLQSAIVNEQDEVVRSQMRASLERLQGKLH